MNRNGRAAGVPDYFFPPRDAPWSGVAASPLTPFPRWPLGRALGRLFRRPRVDSAASLVTLELPANGSLKLRDAAGFTVTCSSGRVWVTQINDAVDVELRAGESLTLAGLGLTLAMAMADSTSETRGVAAAPAGSAVISIRGWRARS